MGQRSVKFLTSSQLALPQQLASYLIADVPFRADLVVANWEIKAMRFFPRELFHADTDSPGRFLCPALLCLVFVAKFCMLHVTDHLVGIIFS